jgi:hypothetical protein
MGEPHRAEPLEVRIGYPIDEAFVTAWAQLEQDPDAPLPTNA